MNDTPEPIAWAVYGGKTGLLRYVVSDEENVRQLVDEGGYVARPLFVHPAPTPPTDQITGMWDPAVSDRMDALLSDAEGNAIDALRLAVWAVVGQLSTPPADDVRAAVHTAIDEWAGSRHDDGTWLSLAKYLLAASTFEVRPHGTVTDATVEQLREARAETWDEAVAAVFAWWNTPEGQRPLAIVNPYGVGLGGGDEAAGEVDQ